MLSCGLKGSPGDRGLCGSLRRCVQVRPAACGPRPSLSACAGQVAGTGLWQTCLHARLGRYGALGGLTRTPHQPWPAGGSRSAQPSLPQGWEQDRLSLLAPSCGCSLTALRLLTPSQARSSSPVLQKAKDLTSLTPPSAGRPDKIQDTS